MLRTPVLHFHRSYWKPGWIEPSLEAFERTVSELVQREEWIMDGNYWRTRAWLADLSERYGAR